MINYQRRILTHTTVTRPQKICNMKSHIPVKFAEPVKGFAIRSLMRIPARKERIFPLKLAGG
jgi:hypothetical protein